MSANETAVAEAQPVAASTDAASADASGGAPEAVTTTDTAAAASAATPTAPPATTGAATAAAMDPSAAVNAAMMAERVIRRASLTAGGVGMANMNMGLLTAGGGMGLMNSADGMAMNQQHMLGDNSLFERAMALQSEQHKNTMALARASLGLDPNDPRASLGLGTLTPRGSLGLGTMGRRASLGLGTMGTRASLGLGTMNNRRASLGFGSMPARPSLGLGTMPGAPGAAPAAGGSPDASIAHSNAAGGGQSDQQTLLRLAQIRTARAEVQAAQARLAELETHTALAASQAAAMGQGGNNEDLLQAQQQQQQQQSAEAADGTTQVQANGAATAAASGDNNPTDGSSTNNANADGTEGEEGEKADARDLEAAETFLSMSGKKQQDQNPSADGTAAADGNAMAANANAMMQPALGMAPGMMMPGVAALGNMNMNMLPAMQMGQMMSGFPRRVSMDLLAQNAGGLPQIPNAALLAEAMIAERRLSNAAGAAANFAVAQERRSTLPMVNGNMMQPGMMQQMNAGDNNNFAVPSGVPVPTASQTGSASTKNSRSRPADAPRRPLSAYNFFFIDERERILKAMKKRDEKKAAEKEDEGDKDGDESKKEDEGKEGEKQEEDPLKDVDLDDSDFSPSTYDELMTLRLNNKEKPRPHRKTHGKIGFQTLAKLIASRWKALAEDRRDHYKSLAAIDMDKYKEKTQEYQKKKMKNSAGEAIPTGESSV